MDANGALASVFDQETNVLRTTTVAGTPGAPDNTPDENGAWAQALEGDSLKVVIV